MKKLPVVAIGTAAALVLAAATGPTMAQLAASAFTVENVLPDAPFGELPVDPMTVNLEDLAGFLALLTPEQLTELQQRCVVIAANPDTYDEASVNLCLAVVANAEAM